MSLLQTRINAMRILSIFFWKQGIQIFRTKGSRCNLLKYSPFIIWNSDPKHIQNKHCDIEQNVAEMVESARKQQPDYSLSKEVIITQLNEQESYPL